MENQRKQYRALRGICLRTALVLVSAVPDLDSERHNDSVLAAGVDAVARSHWRTQRLFRNGGGVAALRNGAPGVSSGGLEREASFGKYFFRGRYRGFRANRPNREIRFANLRWRTAFPDNGTAGCDELRFVSEADAEQDGYGFRV